jgi:hypothetical protein
LTAKGGSWMKTRMIRSGGTRAAAKVPKGVPPRLKPAQICWLYAGIETPAPLRFELFSNL